jgi:hypothetical protein
VPSTCTGDTLGLGYEGSAAAATTVTLTQWYALVFTADKDFDVSGIRVAVACGDTGTSRAEIRDVVSDAPGPTVLGGLTVNDTDLPTVPDTFYCFVLPTPVSLTNGTKYALVLRKITKVSFNLAWYAKNGITNPNVFNWATVNSGSTWQDGGQGFEFAWELYGSPPVTPSVPASPGTKSVSMLVRI